MKITIVGTAYPYRGGLAAFNERLAKEFQKEGDEVKIETFSLQYPNFLFPGKTQYTTDPKPNELTICRSVNSVNPINWVKVGKKIAKSHPDVVIFAYWISFMSPSMGTIAKIIKKKSNAKCIGLIHNMTPHESSLMDRILPSWFLRSMDAFISLSDFVMRDVMNYLGKDLPNVVSPHPIYDVYGESMSRDEAIERLGLSKDYRYLLFFGFIREYKGLDLLLQAMADKRVSQLPVKALIVGEFYGNEQKSTEMASTLGLSNIIWVSDYVSDDKVGSYFCSADVIVQPYKTATQSGVAQIAYHFEKPMIVTNVGGLPEIVPDGKVGYVVSPDSSALADGIARFFNPIESVDFSANIKEEKKKYQWNVLTGKIKKMIESISNGNEQN